MRTPSRRQLLSVAAVPALLVALTACEKPAPGATVFSGTTSAHRAAICWSFDPNRAFDAQDCSINLDAGSADDFTDSLLEKVAIIPTRPGATVGISVDAAVAENGWQVSINGRPLHREPLTEKYFRFTMPPQFLRRGDAQLVIQALTEDGDAVRGSWVFGLSRD